MSSKVDHPAVPAGQRPRRPRRCSPFGNSRSSECGSRRSGDAAAPPSARRFRRASLRPASAPRGPSCRGHRSAIHSDAGTLQRGRTAISPARQVEHFDRAPIAHRHRAGSIHHHQTLVHRREGDLQLARGGRQIVPRLPATLRRRASVRHCVRSDVDSLLCKRWNCRSQPRSISNMQATGRAAVPSAITIASRRQCREGRLARTARHPSPADNPAAAAPQRAA